MREQCSGTAAADVDVARSVDIRRMSRSRLALRALDM
jgi:hypothetical protein